MNEEQVYKAIFGSPETPLKIGTLEIPCYVLEDERRVLSGRGMQDALSLGQSHGALLKQFLDSDNIKPFINNDLAMVLNDPIKFIRPGRGGIPALGYEATVLVDICHAILDARKEKKLTAKQKNIANQAEILTRAFSKVGIIALVDEATGFQGIRARRALEKILEKFIAEEFRKWAKTFPDEFYEHLYRLRGWYYYNPESVKRPSVIGTYTNDLIYERLAPGVLDELRKKNPKDEKGRRKQKLHQWLTEDVGHPRLREHIASVITLMKASTNWRNFYSMMQRALPKQNENFELLLETDKGEIV